MPGLVLELKQDELMIINGAVIKFRVKCRIEIIGRARFLFGKQILLPDECKTPAQRIYLALQIAYVGNDDDRAESLAKAKALLSAYRVDATSPTARDLVERMLSLAELGESFEALKLARTMIRHEDMKTQQQNITVVTDRPIESGCHQQDRST